MSRDPREVRTTCPYCGVGCGVVARVEQDRVIAVSGDRTHPANLGRLCVKGSALAETLVEEGRLLYPSLNGERVSWDRALDTVAERMRSTIDRHGPRSVAFYLSGQLLTEDYYVANKLMKGFLGSANVDTNSRLCMSSAVSGYKRAFGADYVPCSYRDLEEADLLVLVGSNAAWTHPVLYQRIEAARRAHPEKRVVVIDPRRTATCDLADLHIDLKPGADGLLFAGLLQYLHSAGCTDTGYIAKHTEGFDQALSACADLSPEHVAHFTGVDAAKLQRFYRWFADTDRVITVYSQGINQSATGTDKCNAIINCHLATGRLGRSGCGPFSVTGQPNAMGGREVGGLANQLAAHLEFRPSHIDLVSRFWDAPDMAGEAGLTAVDLFSAMAEGRIRFLWIMATNPAVSLPDSALVRRALERCDFVVLSDCVADTDTARYADLLLPASGWGEKDGTVTNSERCISRQRALLPPAGEARPDWWMLTRVAHRLGHAAHFDYDSPADIFVEHAALSGFENAGSRDFDISALAALDAAGYDKLPPTYWPCPAGEAAPGPAEGRFYTGSGRARFLVGDLSLPSLQNRTSGALRLNTGRVRDQWHTMTRTGRVSRLTRHRDFLSVSLNPGDAGVRGVKAGDLVAVENELGRMTALADLDAAQSPGQLFSPIHWNDQFAAAGCVSALLPGIVDPESGQPQSKYAAVDVRPLTVTAWAVLLSRTAPRIEGIPYWSRIAVNGGHITLLAFGTGPGDVAGLCQQWLPGIEGRLLTYRDDRAGEQRLASVARGLLNYTLFLAPLREALPRRDWLEAQLLNEALDYHLLSGQDIEAEDSGRQICSCHEVGEKTIAAAIVAGADSVEALGRELRCGTQCGSCLPELRQLLA